MRSHVCVGMHTCSVCGNRSSIVFKKSFVCVDVDSVEDPLEETGTVEEASTQMDGQY